MQNKRITLKELIVRVTAVFAFVFIGSCIIFVFSKGVPVIGIPKADNIVMVEIIDTVNDKSVVFTDEEHIFLSVKMKNFLLYKINSSSKCDDVGDITIRYYDTKGNITEISADNNTLYYKAKSLSITNPDMFVDFARDVFFS